MELAAAAPVALPLGKLLGLHPVRYLSTAVQQLSLLALTCEFEFAPDLGVPLLCLQPGFVP